MSNDYYTIDGAVINGNQDSGQNNQSSLPHAGINSDSGVQASYSIRSDPTQWVVPLWYESAPVSLTVSQSLIDFGVLTATNPVIRPLLLTVQAGFDGYQILTSEDHPLLSASAATIPDTSCDSGTCTSTTAAPWTNILTFGLGYRCNNLSGDDCVSGFSDPYAFRQFSNAAKIQTPAQLMAGTSGTDPRQSEIFYKVNISGTQKPGGYSNTVTYIAVPNF